MSRRNHRSWTKETSRLAHEAKARKRMAEPVEPRRRIEPGRVLHRIRIENFVSGSGFEVLPYDAHGVERAPWIVRWWIKRTIIKELKSHADSY